MCVVSGRDKELLCICCSNRHSKTYLHHSGESITNTTNSPLWRSCIVHNSSVEIAVEEVVANSSSTAATKAKTMTTGALKALVVADILVSAKEKNLCFCFKKVCKKMLDERKRAV